MSDERIRRLERAARGGNAEAQEALIEALDRAGLTREAQAWRDVIELYEAGYVELDTYSYPPRRIYSQGRTHQKHQVRFLLSQDPIDGIHGAPKGPENTPYVYTQERDVFLRDGAVVDWQRWIRLWHGLKAPRAFFRTWSKTGLDLHARALERLEPILDLLPPDAEKNPPSRRQTPDEKLQRARAQYMESRLPEDRERWIRLGERYGDPYVEQLLEADEHAENSVKPLLFPEVRSWRELFEAELPWRRRYEVEISAEERRQLTRKVSGYSKPQWDWRKVKQFLSDEFPELPASLFRYGGAAKPFADPEGDSVGFNLETEEPLWGYSISGEGWDGTATLRLSPFCSVRPIDPLRSSMYVKARPEVAQKVLDQFVIMGNDEFNFQVTVREGGVALITVSSNRIISSRWIAMIPALEIPQFEDAAVFVTLGQRLGR